MPELAVFGEKPKHPRSSSGFRSRHVRPEEQCGRRCSSHSHEQALPHPLAGQFPWRQPAEHEPRAEASGDAADAMATSTLEAVIDHVWVMGRPEMQTVLPGILTPLQLRMLPWPTDMYFKAKEPIKGLRMFIYGDP